MRPADTDKVLAFWFDELAPEDWFRKSDETDATVREQFLGLYQTLAGDNVSQNLNTAEDHLAAVIVLDQFPRNMFRDDPKSFATDSDALLLAEQAISLKLDVALRAERRKFLYMPFMHSEDPSVQIRSVELFSSLGD